MANRKDLKRWRINRERGVGGRNAPDDVVTRVIAHVEAICDTFGVTRNAFAEAAGVADSTLARVIQKRVASRATAKALLAVTAEKATQSKQFYDAESVLSMIGKMQALGYPVAWQGQRMPDGARYGTLQKLRSEVRTGQKQHVGRTTALAVMALARRIGDTPADPHRDGIREKDIKRAKTLASQDGFYPPAFYDEDGTLDWRAIPDHPWTIADEKCHDHIDNLRFILRNPDLGGKALATVKGSDDVTLETQFDRLLDRFELRVKDPDRKRNAAALRDALRGFDDGEGTPLGFCLDNGIVTLKATWIPRDHPDLIVHPLWLARQEEKKAKHDARNSRRRDRRRDAQAETEPAMAGQEAA